ncbi:aldolase-type tim barrel [Trichoderma arundinaceum]|uniref:Aldolase-type tim barrel n=1 Tax=Trichoderma arundinaceum TaxID=490622 RepID=A0A395NZ99_TRIAR|nr:aldolase-type tim barrel [Trichoderma arundinaceum]
MAYEDSLLFKPLKLGNVELSHRVVLSALTRLRADKNHVATDLMKEYYLQRASIPGGLIIAESAAVAKHHGGMSYTSAIWGEEHVQGWKPIADAIHTRGGFIYLQLMAFGRAAQLKAAEEDGFTIKGPSAIPFEGGSVPKEMTKEDIKNTIRDFIHAAKNAMRAGFDGVEIYAANGYLLDQFIQDVSNQRTDEYGGSIENRNRLVVEIVQAVSDTIGAQRVGIKLSPWSDFQGMRMEHPIPQFTDLILQIKAVGIGYLNFIESRVSGIDYTDGTESLDWAWAIWDKVIIATGGYLPETALELVANYPNKDIAVAFGRRYVANPDLPFRIQRGIELNPYDRGSFYKVGAPEGLIDYPFSKEYLALHK